MKHQQVIQEIYLHRFSIVRTFSKFLFVCGTRVRFDGWNERSVLSNEINHVKSTGNFTCYIWVRMLICYSKKTTCLNKDKIVNLNTKSKFKDYWMEASTHSPTRPQHGSTTVASQKINVLNFLTSFIMSAFDIVKLSIKREESATPAA